ncbi:unnamed protein product [Sphagnum balticum]
MRPCKLSQRHCAQCFGTSKMADSIPVIDIGPLVQQKADPHMAEDPQVMNVVRQLDEACREIGFFYVKGHGVSPGLLEQVLDMGYKFFALPEEDKLQIAMSSDTGFRGYQKLGQNITRGQPDLHEAIDYFRELENQKLSTRKENPLMGSNQWPNEPSGFRPLIEEYVNVMTDLGEAIIQGIALALSGKKDAFGGKRAGDPFWILRVIGYPPMKKSDFEVGCGDHTDYGLLTLVNQDPTIPALQVKNNEGNWIWAKPIPGTFVVNIGDMLKIWTNGLYQSTLHRVVNDDSKYRVSVPFFYEPNFDALVEPLEICKRQTGSAVPRFTPVVYGDHVIGKVLTNFG